MDALEVPVDQIRKLYRGFSEPGHADAFCRGDIRVSTFQICRAIEDAMRRDPDEGRITFTHPVVSIGSGMMTPQQERLAQARIGLDFPDGVWIQGIQFRRSLLDAYMLSLSEDEDTAALKFGPAVVEIAHPVRFLTRVSTALDEQVRPVTAIMNRVAYAHREHQLLAPLAAAPPFIKPVSFQDEKEVRIVWFPVEPQGTLGYANIRSETAGWLCRRVR